jgi:hypothetical protein
MAFVLHWKATLAMTAGYVAIAVLALAVIRDTMLASVVLFIAFFSILLTGNIFLRRSRSMPTRRRGAH